MVLSTNSGRAQEPAERFGAYRLIEPGQASLFSLPSSSQQMPPSRPQLFRIPTGFLSTPVGLENDENGSADGNSDDVPLQVILGEYNPYFDFRRPGDLGGVGYYKLYTQYQFYDTTTSGLSVIMEALTPAGLEADGVAEGPSVVSPKLAWYQDLGGGAAIQAFCGKNIRANPRWVGGMGNRFQYGLSIHSPVPGIANESNQPLFVFMEALGRYRYDNQVAPSQPAVWELLPGLHWRLRDNWWVSGGIIVPVGNSRFDADHWQVTCRWQF